MTREPSRELPPLRVPGNLELEKLLESISAGTIRDQDDLDEAEIELLRRVYGRESDLETLLDQLRGPGRES